MKTPLKFAQFERASNLLENSPETISDSVLSESGITREDLESLNEGFIGDALGSIFKGLKEKILKSIPGSILKKADAILKDYKNTELAIYDKTKKERNKIYVANVDDKDSPRNKEQIIRSQKAIDAIEEASKSKKEAINGKLQMIIKDKGDIVKNYVNMQMFQIQEDIANKKLKDAEEFASEEELDKLEKIVADKKKAKDDAAKAIENAKVKEKEDADKKDNDPKNAKVGQVWKRTDKDGNEQEVEITGLENNEIQLKLAKDTKNNKAGHSLGSMKKDTAKLQKLVKK